MEFHEPFRDFVHSVDVPGGMEAAAWAEAHAASAPAIVPEGWPESRRMCLAVIYRDCPDLDHSCRTGMFLVTRPEAMHFLATHCQRLGTVQALWFRLPRRLFTAAICPTLKPEHWPPEED
jgi:hypothetical protein